MPPSDDFALVHGNEHRFTHALPDDLAVFVHLHVPRLIADDLCGVIVRVVFGIPDFDERLEHAPTVCLDVGYHSALHPVLLVSHFFSVAGEGSESTDEENESDEPAVGVLMRTPPMMGFPPVQLNPEITAFAKVLGHTAS